MAIRPEETKILVAIPCYGNVMKTPFVISLMQLSQRLSQHQINLNILIIGDSLIPRVRNNFASVILHDPKYSHMLFLDCDIEFPPDANLHMLDLEKDIIGTAATRGSQLDQYRGSCEGRHGAAEPSRGRRQHCCQLPRTKTSRWSMANL